MRSKRFPILIILLFGQLSAIFAQYDEKITSEQPEPERNDTLLTSDFPEIFNEDLLNILENWPVEHFLKSEESCLDEEENPFFPDSVYIERMNSLPFLIQMDYNDPVRKCIDLYTGKLRKKIRYMMGMSYYYFPMIEQKFDKEGIPLELKYLAIVESALNPVAQSRVGACGLWQFMLPTAKKCGLEINSLVDERLDPVRSTEAACVYFNKLYGMFKDWRLVIVAYNCGEGNVLKAIRRSGGSRELWRIFPYLPRETRSYLPLYMAAAYVMENHQQHGLCPIMPDFSVATDTLMVERNLSFDRIAEILKIDKEIIKFYNPQYKRGIVPGNIKPSALCLPLKNLHAYINDKDSVYENRLDTLMEACKPLSEEQTAENRKGKITHTVNTGENIYTVANLYGVTAQNLRKWNGLGSGSALAKGRKLTVYIDNGGLGFTASKTNSSKPESQKATASAKTPNSPSAGASGHISYTVKAGDTLSAIASKYKGVTVQKIQTANNMSTTRLKIGQVLKIPQA